MRLNESSAYNVDVIPVSFLKTAGEADLLDDGAECRRAVSQEYAQYQLEVWVDSSMRRK